MAELSLGNLGAKWLGIVDSGSTRGEDALTADKPSFLYLNQFTVYRPAVPRVAIQQFVCGR